MTHRCTIALVWCIPFTGNAQWGPVNSGIADLAQGAHLLGASQTHLFAKAGATMYRSVDNGDSWTVIAPPIDLNPTECGHSTNARYIAGLNASTGCIFYTDNNGDSWTEASGAPTATVVRGFFTFGNGIYAYTSNAGIHVSTNGGSSWQATNNGLSNLNVIAMAAYGPYLLASTIGGGIFSSADGGLNWSATNTGLGADLNGENLWEMNDDFYYTAQGGGRYRSFDLGATWVSWAAPPQLGLGLLEVKRFGPRIYMETRHFAGGLRDSLYATDDEGQTWTNITGNLNAADLNASGILDNDGCVFIGYNSLSPGQGIHRRCGSTDIEEPLDGLLNVFPNPTAGAVTFYTPARSIGLPYRVVDLAGAEVLRGRVNGVRSDLDLSALPTGCYFLRVDDARVPPARVMKR